MKNKLVFLVIVVIVVSLGGILLLRNKSDNQSSQSINQNTEPTQAAQQQVKSAEVNVTVSGFEPKTITIQKGERVVWTNKSGEPVTVNSDAHPTHLLWPFLNLGTFNDGSSVSVVFEKQGTYTYHNHLNTGQTGIVVVK